MYNNLPSKKKIGEQCNSIISIILHAYVCWASRWFNQIIMINLILYSYTFVWLNAKINEFSDLFKSAITPVCMQRFHSIRIVLDTAQLQIVG